MKHKVFSIIIFLSISLIAFWAMENVFAAHTCSDSPLPTFSDGLTSKTITIPGGGGTVEAAKIKLPLGSKISPSPCSVELKIDKAGDASAGTPYIWVPLSENHQLVQIKTSDGTIVHTFSTSTDNCDASAFSDPSRITVLPGAAVWVANRGNGTVTRLGLKTGCTGDNCYECKGTYSDIGNNGPRGVTYDAEGNVWVGAYTNDKICKYKPDGTLIDCQNTGCRTYGMIGDSSGNVWVSDGPNGKVCKCSDAISCSSGFSDSVYGIGMDNDGDIWVGNPGAAEVNEIKGASYGDDAGKLLKSCSVTYKNTGIAIDGNNNVWSDGHWNNQTYVIKGGDCSKVFTKSNVCTRGMPHGVAIDGNNNAWVVCRTGEVIKYAFHDDGDVILIDDGNDDIEEKLRIDLNSCCSSGTGANASYNYSDMTGFRTPKISVTIGNFGPITAMSYPQIINDANYLGFSATLNTTFQNCSCPGCVKTSESICGNVYCEVPITISSSFLGGDYTLSDLKIHYDEPPSKITGGLVPCGRNCDDPSTTIKEDAPCTLCHLFVLAKRLVDFLLILVISVAILMFVVGGIMLVFVAEDPQRANQAKALLTTAAIGLVVIFAAWLIVNALVFFLVEGKAPFTTEIGKIFSQPWNQINCPVE